MNARTLLLPLPVLLLSTGCVVSHHAVQPSALGTSRRSSELLQLVDQPGPLTVETVASADWKVARSGLINLDNPKAKAAHLDDSPEPIQIYFHVIRHPRFGTFIIDTGVDRAQRDSPKDSLFQGLVAKVMHTEWLVVREPLGDFLAKEKEPIKGVLLTHLHMDHISGMRDVPNDTPLYSGPNETSARSLQNFFVNDLSDKALAGKGALNEWSFQKDADGRFDGVLDVFGDGSLWAIWVPGHTEGSTAYLARTETGPVLFVGDTSHTVWGWDHEVEPGAFTADQHRNADSLEKLRALVAEHPSIAVRLGHQQPATR